ncbi:MAG: serine/threonine-protein kinase, partial [Pirellulales bacterium]
MNPARAELPNAVASEPDDARRIGVWIDRFVAEWKADHALTAVAFLHRHADVSDDTRLLAILGYEEYLRRQAAGERIDQHAFSAQLCDGESEFENLLAVHSFLRNHPSFLPGLPALPPVWPAVGETLAGFRLLGVLGRGAFARVYLAEELALGGRRVAVKVSPGGATEGRSLGKLRHPNIVPVFSIQLEPQRDLTLICMPFLGYVTLGGALRALFRDGRRPRRAHDLLQAIAESAQRLEGMPGNRMAAGALADEAPSVAPADPRLTKGSYVDAVISLGEQLADALVYTNRQGIYHRDLKPSNVLLDRRGTPMLLDFNLSFDMRTAAQHWGGTLRYMAPELVRVVAEDSNQIPVDPRSDLFSLAVMLYELLSGAPPFDPQIGGGTPEAACELYICQQSPPLRLSERNPDVEPALSALIARCLSFDVKHRPQTADELLFALRRLA